MTTLLLLMSSHRSQADLLFDWTTTVPRDSMAVQRGGAYVPVGWVERKNGDWKLALRSNPEYAIPTGLQSRGLIAEDFRSELQWVQLQGLSLDYMFMDLEPAPTAKNNENIASIIRLIRSMPSERINRARIGNYGYAPGIYSDTKSFPWPWKPWPDYNEREQFYYSSGLNVAQPDLYPYAFYVNHLKSEINGKKFADGASPNERSALFWAPLERLSSAKRHLPEGHQLVPYVTDYCPWENYSLKPDQQPTPADNRASIWHYRLRGADGIYTFPSAPGDARYPSYDAYKRAVAEAWHLLDFHFDRPGTSRILNLNTDKSSGIEWSALQRQNRVVVAVSNMNRSKKSVRWSIPQLPSLSPEIPGIDSREENHVILQYLTTSPGGTEFGNFSTGYLVPVLDESFAAYAVGDSLSQQGWIGSNPEQWTTQVDSTVTAHGPISFAKPTVATTTIAARRAIPQPIFESNDKVAYSAILYGPTVQACAVPVDDGKDTREISYGGICLGVAPADDRAFVVKRGLGDAHPFRSVQRALLDHWYELQIVVDAAQNSATRAKVYVRDISINGPYEQLTFKKTDGGTLDRNHDSDTTQEILFALTPLDNPSSWNGWQISSSDVLARVGALRAFLYPWVIPSDRGPVND